jgi:hypothetical protein
MKRALVFSLVGCLLGVGTTGCGKKDKAEAEKKTEEKKTWHEGRDESRDSEGSEARAGRDRGESSRKGHFDDKSADAKGPAMKSREGDEARAVMGSRPKKGDPEKDSQAGLITAGSFDDNLYPDFFHSFAGKLGGSNQYLGDIPRKFLGHRLLIAVRTGDDKPMGSARVTVAAKDGAPVSLTARTDGTAIFLSSWDGVSPDGDLEVTVTPPGTTKAVKQTVPRRAERWQIDVPGVSAPLPTRLDLTLVLDTTGSMGDELTYLKAEFNSIVSRVKKLFPEVEQRFALVLYRDEGMGDEYVTRSFPFTPSPVELRKHLNAQSAAGGGDYPEAMHRGLEEAIGLSWSEGNAARVLFLVADAPPHTQHAERTMKAIDALRKKGIAIYPVAASGADEACEFVMRSAALLTGGQYLFLTDDSGKGESHGEPHIPYYQVEKLNALMVRMIAGELSGRRIEPKPGDILRTVGRPINTSGKKR